MTCKIIWMYWDLLPHAPDVVQQSITSWRNLNPAWTVRVVDKASERQWLSPRAFAWAERNPTCTVQAWSDALRTDLLAQHGGVWTDATVWCLKPLDSWLSLGHEFISFQKPRTGICSWFLYVAPGCRFFAEFVDQVFCADIRGKAYLWWHHLFKEHLAASGGQDLLPQCQFIPVGKGHYFAPYSESVLNPKGCQSPAQLWAALGDAPVVKLSWRQPLAEYPFYAILIERFNPTQIMRRPGRQGWTAQQFRDRRAALKAQAKYCAAAKAKLKKMSGNPPSQAVRLRSREKHADRRKNHHKRGESAASQAAPGHTSESVL